MANRLASAFLRISAVHRSYCTALCQICSTPLLHIRHNNTTEITSKPSNISYYLSKYQQEGGNNKNSSYHIVPGLALLAIASCKENHDQDDLTEGLVEEWFRAVSLNDISHMRQLLEEGLITVDTKHSLGWNALHVAASHGNEAAVKFLLQHGADVDAQDDYSIKDCGDYNVFEARFLRQSHMGAGMRANADFQGTTALHYAALNGHRRIADILLEAGADPTITNSAGHTPLDYTSAGTNFRKAMKRAVDKINSEKKERLAAERRRYPLEARLSERLVGQRGAIHAVASAIRRKQAGWGDDEHPLVMLFLGSSGIGKTELAKQAAYYMHGDKTEAFIRLDMSEYQSQHEVAKLIGAPPGYVGHNDGGQLTKALTKCPTAVVEKAHSDLLTVLLQLFDEGRMTDGKGNTIECKEATFIMTSNLAQTEIADHAAMLRVKADDVQREKLAANKDSALENVNLSPEVSISRSFHETCVQPILKAHFKRDELLGRINEMVYFLPFSTSELYELVERELEDWKKRAQNRHNVNLVWDQHVVELLREGYNIRYGARSIKHEVEKCVVNKLAMAHERGLIGDGSTVQLVVGDTKTINLRVTKGSNSKSEDYSLIL